MILQFQVCLLLSTVCSLHFNYQGWEVQTNDTELSANDIGRLGVQSNIKSMLLLMLLHLPTRRGVEKYADPISLCETSEA